METWDGRSDGGHAQLSLVARKHARVVEQALQTISFK